jgi:hypothetical protein
MNTRIPIATSVILGLAFSFAGCSDTPSASHHASTQNVVTSRASTATSASAAAIPSKATTSTTIVIADASNAHGSGDLWKAYGAALSGADEAEGFSDFRSLAKSADLAVVGQLGLITVGRMIEIAPGAPTSRLQFLNFEVIVEQPVASRSSIVFELPVSVESPELLEATRAAVNPIDLNGDGNFSDDELSAGYNRAGVQAAYDRFWNSALEHTVREVREMASAESTLFLLRYVEMSGTYRPINGDAIIVDVGGMATTPWRTSSDHPEWYPVAHELSRLPFDKAVAIALS